MKRPSVIARPLEEARRLLEEAGARAVEVVETGPPRGGPTGALRVVRERWTGEGVHLVVAASVVLAEEEKQNG